MREEAEAGKGHIRGYRAVVLQEGCGPQGTLVVVTMKGRWCCIVCMEAWDAADHRAVFSSAPQQRQGAALRPGNPLPGHDGGHEVEQSALQIYFEMNWFKNYCSIMLFFLNKKKQTKKQHYSVRK